MHATILLNHTFWAVSVKPGFFDFFSILLGGYKIYIPFFLALLATLSAAEWPQG